jgi:hypothetical protein
MEVPNDAEQPAEDVTEQALLRQFLADRDVPCPACGYNIRQLQRNTCPECGRGLKLVLGVVGPSNCWITALVASLVPAACGLPFQILILIALAYGENFSDIVREPSAVLFLFLVFYSLCCWVFSILLLVMRQRFMRLRAQAQNGIASALVIADVVGVILILALFGSL